MFDVFKRRKAVTIAHAKGSEEPAVANKSELETLVEKNQELGRQQDAIRLQRLELRKRIDALLKGDK